MDTQEDIKRPPKTPEKVPSDEEKKAGRVRILRIVRNTAGLLCFFLMPFVSFYLFETVTGNLGNIADI